MKEATRLQSNRQLQKDWQGVEDGHSSEDDEAGPRRRKSKAVSQAEKLAGTQGWKKGAKVGAPTCSLTEPILPKS
jgi:hypothetical protein